MTNPAMVEAPELMTISETAEFLRMSVNTIQNWKRDKKIKFTQIGRMVRIPRSQFKPSEKTEVVQC
ncbi:hypothetical protein AGMMS49991_04640 [Spirochaetia bacterium]|nr:hypothetical protein AGMMS49991_04640 [Spirochaetia bacterium]